MLFQQESESSTLAAGREEGGVRGGEGNMFVPDQGRGRTEGLSGVPGASGRYVTRRVLGGMGVPGEWWWSLTVQEQRVGK